MFVKIVAPPTSGGNSMLYTKYNGCCRVHSIFQDHFISMLNNLQRVDIIISSSSIDARLGFKTTHVFRLELVYFTLFIIEKSYKSYLACVSYIYVTEYKRKKNRAYSFWY